MIAGIPRPPDRPHDDECCRRGCCPCIFDYYEDALERWETRVLAMGHDPAEALRAARGGVTDPKRPA